MNLVIEDEEGTRSVVPFTGDSILVGRASEGVTFRLRDRNVSRRHARFIRQNGYVFVEDLGSLTGTRVNGERITGRRRLRTGDLVQIGDYDLAVLEEGAAAEAGAPPPLPAAAPPPTAASAAATSFPHQAGATRDERTKAGTGTLRRVLVAGALALAAGLAAGYAVGALTARPGAVTRP